MKNTLILACLIILFTSSCKKWQHRFPEDTERTKDTPTERLINKWWTLVSTTLNGQDYTDTIKQQFGQYQIRFETALAWTPTNGMETYSGYVQTDYEPGFPTAWRFYNVESITTISLMQNPSFKKSIVPCYLNSFSYTYETQRILKLTNTEFKISIQTKNQDSTIINYFKAL